MPNPDLVMMPWRGPQVAHSDSSCWYGLKDADEWRKKRGSYSRSISSSNSSSTSEDNEIYHPTAKPQNYRNNNKHVTSNKGHEKVKGFLRAETEAGTPIVHLWMRSIRLRFSYAFYEGPCSNLMALGGRVLRLPVGIMVVMRGIKTSPTLATSYISNGDDHQTFSVSRKSLIALNGSRLSVTVLHQFTLMSWWDVAVVRQSRKHFMKLNNMQLERNRSGRAAAGVAGGAPGAGHDMCGMCHTHALHANALPAI